MNRASPGEKLKGTGAICGAEKVLSPFLAALQLSNTAGHSIPPKQPMNVVVAPTASQLIALLAANPSEEPDRRRKKKIVLNMANIKYIDSAGLGTLVAAHLSAKTQGASVRLRHLGNKFHEVLQMTKLLTVFDVYDTEAAAVSSFQSFVAASN